MKLFLIRPSLPHFRKIQRVAFLQLDLRRNATRCMLIIAASAGNFKCFLLVSDSLSIWGTTQHCKKAKRLDGAGKAPGRVHRLPVGTDRTPKSLNYRAENALHSDDDAIEGLRTGKFNRRLLSKLICRKDFRRFMPDAEICVDRIADMRVNDMNAVLETVRQMALMKMTCICGRWKLRRFGRTCISKP